jgi:hypothetical protein
LSRTPVSFKVFLFGDESFAALLEVDGIAPTDSKKNKDTLKVKQCPNCNSQRPDARFCAKCKIVMTYNAFNETIEEDEKSKKTQQEL